MKISDSIRRFSLPRLDGGFRGSGNDLWSSRVELDGTERTAYSLVKSEWHIDTCVFCRIFWISCQSCSQ